MKKVSVAEVVNTHQQNNKQKYTNCFITINTNKTNIQLIPQFREKCREIFNNIENYIDYQDLNKVGDEYIDSITCQYKIEIGSKLHCIHVHALIKIAHHSFIKVLFREMKEDLRKKMNIDTDFHLDVQYLKSIDNELNILEYMKKF